MTGSQLVGVQNLRSVVPDRAESWAPRSPVEQPGERERCTAMAGGVGEVYMLQSLLSPTHLSHTTLSNKVRGIFLQRIVSARLYCVVVMHLHVYVYGWSTNLCVAYDLSHPCISSWPGVFYGHADFYILFRCRKSFSQSFN